ncbi:MAG: hypothetical protein C0605_14475 [Hyphomicrobiales bacterium]|nr:MAG: hypothetical protein C0605_14475 [Hyphomicrobiales bacterium]
MNTASRYILSQIMKPLLVSVAIGLLLLLSERMVRLLEITLGQTQALSLVFEMLSYLVPHYLGFALPGAFFIGLMLGFNNLSKNSEVDAFLAGGIGLHQLVRPLMALSLVFMVLAIAMFGYIQPYTRYAFYMLKNSINTTAVYYLAEEGIFMHIGNKTFSLDNISRESKQFQKVFIFADNGKKSHTTTTANSGRILERGVYNLPVLRLTDGKVMRVNLPRPGGSGAEGAAGKGLKNAKVSFYERLDTLLGKEAGPLRRERGQSRRELTLMELWRHIDNPPGDITRNEIVSEFNDRVIRILMIPVLPLLAIPFALSRRRGYRSYRFATAIVLLIAFNEILQNGRRAVMLGAMPPLIVQWLPFALFAGFAFWNFYRAGFTLASPTLDPIWERVHAIVKRVSAAAQKLIGIQT